MEQAGRLRSWWKETLFPSWLRYINQSSEIHKGDSCDVEIYRAAPSAGARGDASVVDLSRCEIARESRLASLATDSRPSRANGGHAVVRSDWPWPYCSADRPISAAGSMAVPSDDAMVNSTARAERLVGDECRICLKSCTEACQLFRDDRGIPEKLMAVAAVQVSSPSPFPSPSSFLSLPASLILKPPTRRRREPSPRPGYLAFAFLCVHRCSSRPGGLGGFYPSMPRRRFGSTSIVFR